MLRKRFWLRNFNRKILTIGQSIWERYLILIILI